MLNRLNGCSRGRGGGDLNAVFGGIKQRSKFILSKQYEPTTLGFQVSGVSSVPLVGRTYGPGTWGCLEGFFDPWTCLHWVYSRPGDSPRIVGALGLGPGRECVYFFGYFVERGGGCPESSAKCCGIRRLQFFGYFAKGAEESWELQLSVVVIRRLQLVSIRGEGGRGKRFQFFI